jgi:hypothetical protein
MWKYLAYWTLGKKYSYVDSLLPPTLNLSPLEMAVLCITTENRYVMAYPMS